MTLFPGTSGNADLQPAVASVSIRCLVMDWEGVT
jgi:hypothetical protein